MQVLHHCDNPSCIRPDHLFLGDIKDNMQDMLSKGRENKAKGSSVNTAKLTEEAVKAIRSDTRSVKEIAAAYSVGQLAIYRVINNQTWKHVL